MAVVAFAEEVLAVDEAPAVDVDALAARSPGELVGTWMAVARAQAGRRGPADLRGQHRRDGYVQPSAVDQRTAARLDVLALASAPDHEALLLSPVAPLGVCSALAPTSQDRTLVANRGTEVVSDPTNVLALECAERLAGGASAARLVTVHQVLRAQALPPGEGFSRHFRLLALADAGRGLPSHGFERQAVLDHVAVFDRLLDACAAEGWRAGDRAVVVCGGQEEPVLADRVAADMADRFPHLAVRRQALENDRYYDGLRVLYVVGTPAAGEVPIGDVGRFDWVGRLLGDRKVRTVCGGFGVQLVPLLLGGASG